MKSGLISLTLFVVAKGLRETESSVKICDYRDYYLSNIELIAAEEQYTNTATLLLAKNLDKSTPPEKDTKIMPLCWHQINNSMDIPREEKKKALGWIEQNLNKVHPDRRLENSFVWSNTKPGNDFWFKVNNLI